MKKTSEQYDSIEHIAKMYKESYPELTNYQCIKLAIEEQRNKILEFGLGVSRVVRKDGVNTYLENVDVSLSNISDALDSITEHYGRAVIK